jgi:hypothetical protein
MAKNPRFTSNRSGTARFARLTDHLFPFMLIAPNDVHPRTSLPRPDKNNFNWVASTEDSASEKRGTRRVPRLGKCAWENVAMPC